MRAMRLLLPLAYLTTVQAFTNGTCLEHLSDSISCRWQRRHSTWDVPKRNGLGRIAVVYYQPPTLKQPDLGLERALETWTRATKRQVLMLNVASLEKARPTHPGELCHFLQRNVDHLIVKSNWDYVVDVFVRRHLWEDDGGACALTRSLQIAGSYPPPTWCGLSRFYDVLYPETTWYLDMFLKQKHPRLVQAFGIDADGARDACVPTEQTWDYLFVGAFGDHLGFKRPEALAQLTGRAWRSARLKITAGRSRTSPGEPSIRCRRRASRCASRGWSDMMALVASSSNVSSPTTGAGAANGPCSRLGPAASLFW